MPVISSRCAQLRRSRVPSRLGTGDEPTGIDRAGPSQGRCAGRRRVGWRRGRSVEGGVVGILHVTALFGGGGGGAGHGRRGGVARRGGGRRPRFRGRRGHLGHLVEGLGHVADAGPALARDQHHVDALGQVLGDVDEVADEPGRHHAGLGLGPGRVLDDGGEPLAAVDAGDEGREADGAEVGGDVAGLVGRAGRVAHLDRDVADGHGRAHARLAPPEEGQGRLGLGLAQVEVGGSAGGGLVDREGVGDQVGGAKLRKLRLSSTTASGCRSASMVTLSTPSPTSRRRVLMLRAPLEMACCMASWMNSCWRFTRE